MKECKNGFFMGGVAVTARTLMTTNGEEYRRRTSRIPVGGMSEMKGLPDDVILDILSRLSVKSLLRFTCVCTTWQTIIFYDPHFAKMHIKKATENSLPSLLLWTKTHPCKLYLIDLDSPKQDEHFHNYQKLTSKAFINTHIDYLENKFCIYGSCNGLLLLSGQVSDALYICNPITGEYGKLPPPTHKDNNLITSGLGFDATNNEYKAIQIYFAHPLSSEVMAQVHTIGTNEWRNIADVPDIFCEHCPTFSEVCYSLPVVAQGALHWLTFLTKQIISFSLEDEKFHVAPLPCPCLAHYRHPLGLTTVRGCLSFVAINHVSRSHYYDVWVMKDYRIKESWNKEGQIRCGQGYYPGGSYGALCIHLNCGPNYGEFSLKASCDAQLRLLSEIETYQRGFFWFEVITFSASLAFPGDSMEDRFNQTIKKAEMKGKEKEENKRHAQRQN